LKCFLKGTYWQSAEDMHKKTADLLKAVSLQGMLRGLEDLGAMCSSDGNYFEGDKI
jgi:hypothetical protein